MSKIRTSQACASENNYSSFVDYTFYTIALKVFVHAVINCLRPARCVLLLIVETGLTNIPEGFFGSSRAV